MNGYHSRRRPLRQRMLFLIAFSNAACDRHSSVADEQREEDALKIFYQLSFIGYRERCGAWKDSSVGKNLRASRGVR